MEPTDIDLLNKALQLRLRLNARRQQIAERHKRQELVDRIARMEDELEALNDLDRAYDTVYAEPAGDGQLMD